LSPIRRTCCRKQLAYRQGAQNIKMLLGLASLYLPTVAAGGSTNSTNGTEVHHDSHDEHNSGGLAIFFFALVLVLGVVTHTIAEWISLPIPYTVLMLILGMLIGASNLQGGPGDNWFHEAMDMYATIDPHLLLGIFLPALIFESAFSSSFHIIKRELGQALLLAGPGVAISMILAAVVGVYIFPYNWSWWAALVFGSILSATDPVAVVALLRELGVSKKLATLIEGESLFNDGTAYVMFLVWREFLVGDELAVWEIITLMLRLAIGGIVFGILFSIPALLWLWSIYANPAIETTITFATAYLCFWFAESHETGIHVSGVLAIVALGLMFNRFKYFISIQAEETVHHFWEMVGFIANTLIFFISGVVVVQRMFADNPNIQLGRDFLFLFILYVLIHVIRGFTVLVLGYPLAKMGYGFNWPMGIVLVWGGLRGAVGLALALMLDLDDEVPDAISDQILFHVAGIVVLTLLINGSTTGTVLGWVGLRKIKPSKLRAYLKAVEAIKAESERKAISMRSEKMFQMADWDLVRRYLPQYEHKTRDLALAKVKEIPFHLEDNDIINMFKDTKELPYPPVRAPSSIVSRDDLKCELTHRLLTAMSAHFSEAYEEGQLSRNAISILNEAAETALDTDSLDVLWKTIDRYFEVSPMMTFLTSCWPWLANKLYLFEFQLAVELAVAFLHALHVIEKVDTLFEQFADHEVYEEMVKEVEEYREKAIIRWDQVETDFPNLYNSMQTLFAIRRLLESEKRAINKLHVKGIIDENEKLKLQDALARQMHWVQFHSIESGQRISSSEIISQIEFWDLLSPQLQRRLKHCRRIAVASKHRVHPHRSNKMFYVMRGILKVQDAAGNKVHVLGIGDLYGTWAAMADRSYIASAVSRSDPAVLLEIDRALLTTMKQDTKLRELLWKISAADVLQMKYPPLENCVIALISVYYLGIRRCLTLPGGRSGACVKQLW